MRTGTTTNAVSATIGLTDGIAVSTADYDNTPIVVSFAAGETRKVVEVPLVDDAIAEGDETLTLTLGDVSEGAQLGNQSTTTLTIVDNDFAYRAVASADIETGIAGTPVVIRGQALSNEDNSPVSFAAVTVDIETKGTTRQLKAFTDFDGNFTTTFQPLPGEGGAYSINAYNSNNLQEDAAEEDQFSLLGMRLGTQQATHKLFANKALTSQVEIKT